MLEIFTPAAMRAWADRTRAEGRRIGLVPTMGYLHEGHLNLVAAAQRLADACVASIFVNPMQFGAHEDLSTYPRNMAGDRAHLERAAVEVLYLPDVDAMYPPGFQTDVTVNKVTTELCGRSRPGHFRGVTTVVNKLFNAVKPHVAIFGEKDFQQLAAIRRMAADLDFGIDIVGVSTVREADGVAMSSRNAYLSDTERTAARSLPRALAAARDAVTAGVRQTDTVLARARAVLEAEPQARIDYAELVDAETIEPVDIIERPALLALAVFIGRTRLIDNTVLVPMPSPAAVAGRGGGVARGPASH